MNLAERTFEIVLVSSDRTEREWKTHHQTMPWMSLPWGDERGDLLRAKFGIMGVPVLIILDATTGFVVSASARKDLKKDVNEVYENWAKLLDLKKQNAVERAEQDAIADAQRKERDHREKLKKEEAKNNASIAEATVAAEHA